MKAGADRWNVPGAAVQCGLLCRLMRGRHHGCGSRLTHEDLHIGGRHSAAGLWGRPLALGHSPLGCSACHVHTWLVTVLLRRAGEGRQPPHRKDVAAAARTPT